MTGIREMFAEFEEWESNEFDFFYAAACARERYLEEHRENERKRRDLIKRIPTKLKDVRDKWNQRDKKRRASDPEYAEKRRKATRERMRRLRERRKLEREHARN